MKYLVEAEIKKQLLLKDSTEHVIYFESQSLRKQMQYVLMNHQRYLNNKIKTSTLQQELHQNRQQMSLMKLKNTLSQEINI